MIDNDNKSTGDTFYDNKDNVRCFDCNYTSRLMDGKKYLSINRPAYTWWSVLLGMFDGKTTDVNHKDAKKFPPVHQIVPCCFFVQGSEYSHRTMLRDGNDKFMLYRRHSSELCPGPKLSLYVSDHLRCGNSIFEGMVNTVNLNVRRINSVYVTEIAYYDFHGLLHDESTDYGCAHIGVVFSAKIYRPSNIFLVGEDKDFCGWVTKGEIKDAYNDLDEWSQIIFDEEINR